MYAGPARSTFERAPSDPHKATAHGTTRASISDKVPARRLVLTRESGLTMADARLEDHGRWLALGGDYDPGALVFDWFNERQLADLAQSLGLNLELARQITRDKKGTDGLKVSLKVVELSGGNERGLAEAATHAGALPTATFIEIYVRLRRESRLQVLSKPSVDGPTGMLAACRSAASSDTWALIEGDWTVSHDPICLTLVRPAGASRDLEDGELRLEALIPAKPDELLPTGRVRLTPGLRLRATVFGQIESWIEQEPSLTLIAHAEFARVGDPRFEWHGRSYGDASNGDF